MPSIKKKRKPRRSFEVVGVLENQRTTHGEATKIPAVINAPSRI
jgi:hypothetical protein